MRWDFADPADLDEARARQPIVEAMDRWWEAFARDADRLDRCFSRRGRDDGFDAPGFTNEHLQPVHPDLCWEYGPALRKRGHRLVITPEWRHHLAPMVRALLKRAPSLPNWEFYPHRLPDTPEVALGTAEQLHGIRPTGVRAGVALGPHRRIDVLYHVDGVDEDPDVLRKYAVRITEHLLGEDVLDHWIGVVDLVEPADAAADKLAWVPFDRLRPTIQALVASAQEQLPREPRHASAASPGAEEPQWYSLTRKAPVREDYARFDDLVAGVTNDLPLWRAAHEDSLFASRRFSRVGESFCYLKIDGRNGAGRFADRGEIEDAMGAALGDAHLGSLFGGGTGRIYSYIDLALMEVRRAIPVICGVLRRGKIHRRSWLLFYDAELADEWVGIWDDTPAPPNKR